MASRGDPSGSGSFGLWLFLGRVECRATEPGKAPSSPVIYSYGFLNPDRNRFALKVLKNDRIPRYSDLVARTGPWNLYFARALLGVQLHSWVWGPLHYIKVHVLIAGYGTRPVYQARHVQFAESSPRPNWRESGVNSAPLRQGHPSAGEDLLCRGSPTPRACSVRTD